MAFMGFWATTEFHPLNYWLEDAPKSNNTAER